MNHICLNAYAKINLGIDVLGKFPNGYHDLNMIVQPISLHDTLFIKKTNDPGIKIACNIRWLPTDDKNLVYRAAKLMIETYDIKGGLFFEITKNIPVSAGLGGGSADCAATILGIRKLYDLDASRSDILKLGLSLGADVPYCLFNKTAHVTGIGEHVEPLKPHPTAHVLLVKPFVKVSTTEVFQAFSQDAVTSRPDIPHMLEGISEGNLAKITQGFGNALESVTEKMLPEIPEIKKTIMSCGALGALMSGSGPTVFGYFNSKKDAILCYKVIKKAFPSIHEIFVTSTFTAGQL